MSSDSDSVLMSNVLEVSLPLDTSEIRLPVREARLEEEELYTEYLEISQGSGYLPAMDSMYSLTFGLFFTANIIENTYYNTVCNH